MTKTYKERVSLSERISESNRIIAKHPAYIPVIIEIDEKFGVMKKNKFLVPGDVSASHLMISIRNQIKCKKEEALFMFSDDTLICSTMLISELYEKYMNKRKQKDVGVGEQKYDRFFYINIHGENTFG